MTETYDRRTAANFVDFLEKVDLWLPIKNERVHAILDNLSAHRATDVLLFALGQPRWEFVFQQVRGLPEPDRAVVEGPAVAGLERTTV